MIRGLEAASVFINEDSAVGLDVRLIGNSIVPIRFAGWLEKTNARMKGEYRGERR